MTIPFVREMAFAYGEAQQVSPLIRRLVANNSGPFTFLGTGVYIIGQGDVAVIDPGPDDAAHLDAIMRALAGERLTHIFVTHGHADHSPAARPLAQRTGAKIYASPIPVAAADVDLRVEADEDTGFRPDRFARDGDRFAGPGWTIEAIATPGHTASHTCFALIEENACFTGDHIMGWSTTVISPPDGDMDDYLSSLEKIRGRNFTTLWPTHGPPILAPRPFIGAYIAHRQHREAEIIARLEAGDARIPDMVAVIYADVDKRLHPAACHSVLAHMIRLVKRGRVACEGAPSVASVYALTSLNA